MLWCIYSRKTASCFSDEGQLDFNAPDKKNLDSSVHCLKRVKMLSYNQRV